MIAITGGGTGGHLAIAKALKEELNSRGIKPLFVGSTNGQDRAWFEDDDGFCEKYFLDTGGVVNKKGLAKISALYRVFKNGVTCTRLIRQKGITKVISVGGYSAAPLVFACIITRWQLYIHEQNAVVGKLNRLARPFASAFFSSFEESSPCKSYPVPKVFFELARTREEVRTVIFLGGSQGATAINELALSVAKELSAKGIRIIHQSGARDLERVRARYDEIGVEATLFDFSKELVKFMQEADFAVSRAGASAMFELCANRLPTFFVPYPYAAANHQEHNARYLADKGLASYANEPDLTPEIVLDAIFNTNVFGISTKLENVIASDGAKCIVDMVLTAKEV
jgi:UDP-N-acetylglucosamine--N-acetylmuramyl-(pentapeptide) pyrophosphoryl-undecaprenol N-acetylglucosamine transferase